MEIKTTKLLKRLLASSDASKIYREALRTGNNVDVHLGSERYRLVRVGVADASDRFRRVVKK